MLTKIFPTGQGKGYGPVEYLCAVNPFGRGERYQPPQVLSGDPALIRRQIDAVPFKQKYTSGVHSFAHEDNPTDEQIMEVIEATEELAFAGLPLSSRSILWVRHIHAGRTELHFLIPRQEVNTGKAFNAFPPGWQKKYDTLRDAFNFRYGWARPDDPERARHWQQGINAKIFRDAERRKKSNPKSEMFNLTDDIGNMALQGKLTTRYEIVCELRRRGYGISRQGKNYITIVDKEGNRTRLKGTLFEENFYGPSWIRAENARFGKKLSLKALSDQEMADKAYAMLQEAIRKTASYNQIRYGLMEKKNDNPPREQSTKNARSLCFTRGEKEARSVKGSQRIYTAIEKSINHKTDAAIALFNEQRLGNGSTAGVTGERKRIILDSVRKIPLSEQPLHGMGRGTGDRRPLEKGYRESTEQFHGRCNPDTQYRLGTSTGNNRRQSREPGGYDQAYYGNIERIARQGIQTGKKYQNLIALIRNTRKMGNCLVSRHKLTFDVSSFDPSIPQGLANLKKTAGQAIDNIRLVHEKHLLKQACSSLSTFISQDLSPLMIEMDKSINSLRKVADIRMIMKIQKSDMNIERTVLRQLESETKTACSELRRANGQNLIHQLATAAPLLIKPAINLTSSLSIDMGQNVADSREEDGASLAQQPLLEMAPLSTLSTEAKRATELLAQLSELRLIVKLNKIIPILSRPSLTPFSQTARSASCVLHDAIEQRMIQELKKFDQQLQLPNLATLSQFAKNIPSLLESISETKVIATVFQAEMRYKRDTYKCIHDARWAGSNLERWRILLNEYKKYKDYWKIMKNMLDSAYGRFSFILSKTRNLEEIKKLCSDDPFLLRELSLLKKNIATYYNDRITLSPPPKEMEKSEQGIVVEIPTEESADIKP